VNEDDNKNENYLQNGNRIGAETPQSPVIMRFKFLSSRIVVMQC